MKKTTERPLLYHNVKYCGLIDETLEEVPALSYREIVKGCPRVKIITSVSGDRKHFTASWNNYILIAMGGKIFWRRSSNDYITYKDGKFYGRLTSDIAQAIIQAFHLDWISQEPYILRVLTTNKTLWKMVIDEKITNPKSLLRKYSNLYFKGVYSYKALKGYFIAKRDISLPSLWNVYYHTTNPNLFIERMLDDFSKDDREDLSLLRDVVQYCQYDNSKLNPLWSKRRLQEVHREQVDLDLEEALENKKKKLSQSSVAPYVPEFSGGEEFSKTFKNKELILDECNCFKESLYMHNCIYSCYWDAVKAGRYLIIKGDSEDHEHFNLGIRIRQGIAEFDQVYARRNRQVSEQVQMDCQSWIAQNQKPLVELAGAIKDEAVKLCLDKPF
jgi:hypothetical protein